MKYMEIVRQALVIPEHRNWGVQVLGSGAIVGVVERSVSPLGITELAVQYVDVVGRETLGWIAPSTVMKPARAKALVNRSFDPTTDIAPVDWVRNRVMLDQQRDTESGWTLTTWVATFGHQHLVQLRNAVRELGSNLPTTASADTTISRALRLISNGEINMSTEQVQETKDATKTKKTATKRVAAKKSAAKHAEAAGGRSMARTAGNTLVPLLTKAGAKKGIAIAKALAAGKDVGKKQLLELREAVNGAATAARESKKESLASSLSSANRIVRRLARGA